MHHPLTYLYFFFRDWCYKTLLSIPDLYDQSNQMRSCQNMALSKSILSFPIRIKNFFVAAFYGYISSGIVTNGSFDSDLSFNIEHFQIVDFYCVLIRLLSCANSANYPSPQLNFSENNYWQVLSGSEIVLVIKNHSICLSLEAFNDFLQSFAKLIFPCLGLKDVEKLALESATHLTQTEITQLKDLPAAVKFISNYKMNNSLDSLDVYNISLILVRFRDFILVYKKLMSVFQSDLCELSIEMILHAV